LGWAAGSRPWHESCRGRSSLDPLLLALAGEATAASRRHFATRIWPAVREGAASEPSGINTPGLDAAGGLH